MVRTSTICTIYDPLGGVAKTQAVGVSTGSITYDIYGPAGLAGSATQTVALSPEEPPQIDPTTGLLGQPTCPNLVETWTPYEPARQFGDPGLP
ncbi:MAG: hypothetical protein M3Y18_00495 [Candidatus Eremiobacteraeota bacterium]|nr:hypothetical protein [Candidatus Eremiobacteraeota bacterium]